MTERDERRARLRDLAHELRVRRTVTLTDGQINLAIDLNRELDATIPPQYRDEPTEPGWYWVRFQGKNPFVLKLRRSYDKKQWWYVAGGGMDVRWGGDSQECAGPLQPPEVPNE